jgi:hypothetical protein
MLEVSKGFDLRSLNLPEDKQGPERVYKCYAELGLSKQHDERKIQAADDVKSQ